jgi:glycosyltransferase involved in cell wall biosynthesis
MASARAVVASRRPILDDYVVAEEDALLVPPEDPGGLADAIERVLADRALAARLGAAARRRVEDGLTTRHFAQSVAAVLQELWKAQKVRTIRS